MKGFSTTNEFLDTVRADSTGPCVLFGIAEQNGDFLKMELSVRQARELRNWLSRWLKAKEVA